MHFYHDMILKYDNALYRRLPLPCPNSILHFYPQRNQYSTFDTIHRKLENLVTQIFTLQPFV